MSHVGGGTVFAWWQFFAWVGRFGVDWGDCSEGGVSFVLEVECWGGGMVGRRNVGMMGCCACAERYSQMGIAVQSVIPEWA